MKQRQILAGCLAAALTVTALFGCGSQGKTKDTKKTKEEKQIFRYSSNSVVLGLNPILNTTAADDRMHNMLCEPLVRSCTGPNNTNVMKPGAAESWEESEDGKTYTFHLRKDMTWSDGSPLTAQDYVYTMKKMADPQAGATAAWLFCGIVENFSDALYDKGKTPDEIGCEAPDDDTFVVHLEHPTAYFTEILHQFYPVQEKAYEKWDSKYGSTPDKLVCSGPFKLKKWDQNTEVVVERNDNNWNAKNVQLDEIHLKIIQDHATAIQAFLAGDLDVTGTSDPGWQQKISEAKIAETVEVPSDAAEFVMFNMDNEFLKNTKIRQALSIGFDRKDYVKTIFNDSATPAYSLMPDTMKVGEETYTDLVAHKNYFVEDLIKEYPDPKALLVEGLKEEGLSPDPAQVTLKLASRGTTEFSKKIVEWFKQEWEKNLGIHVDIDMMEWNVMWDKIDSGDFDIALGGWVPEYNEPTVYLQIFEPEEGYFNADKIGWKSEDAVRYADLLERAKDVVDPKEKADIYLEAEGIVVKNAVISPEYFGVSPAYIANRVHGYHIATVGRIDWSDVSVDPK